VAQCVDAEVGPECDVGEAGWLAILFHYYWPLFSCGPGYHEDAPKLLLVARSGKEPALPQLGHPVVVDVHEVAKVQWLHR
jgi:hypothetical protein